MRSQLNALHSSTHSLSPRPKSGYLYASPFFLGTFDRWPCSLIHTLFLSLSLNQIMKLTTAHILALVSFPALALAAPNDSSITVTLASTNPTAVPLSSINPKESPAPTSALPPPYPAGTKPPGIPNAPGLPDSEHNCTLQRNEF
jgi:hypothetical protein